MTSWERPTDQGIYQGFDSKTGSPAFYAGHLQDVLILNKKILAAAPSSGVWNMVEGLEGASNFTQKFSKNAIHKVKAGVYSPEHVYAAGNILLETRNSLADWHEIPLVDTFGSALTKVVDIWDILVLPAKNKLILACDKGLYWCNIPPVGGQYAFQRAIFPTGIDGTTLVFSGIAEGPYETLVAAVWGQNTRPGDPSGIYRGLFEYEGIGRHRRLLLVMSNTHLSGGVQSYLMARTSIASFPYNRKFIFAVAGRQSNGTIYFVLKSVDGGLNWGATGSTVIDQSKTLFGNQNDTEPLAGDQQEYNNCITVGPHLTSGNHQRVVIGWRSGYFVSDNSGNTWAWHVWNQSPHGHPDLHSVVFDASDRNQNTLYICSDGGLAVTKDLGKTYSSIHNRRLPNLQIKRFSPNPIFDGVLAISTQDNGDAYCPLYYEKNVPWYTLDGSDGVKVLFMPNGRLLVYNSTQGDGAGLEFGNLVRDKDCGVTIGPDTFSIHSYQQTSPPDQGIVPIDGLNIGMQVWLYNPPGYQASALPREPAPMSIVRDSQYIDESGKSLIVVTARSPNPNKQIELFGLFLLVDLNWSTADVHWARLGTMPAVINPDGSSNEHITAVGSDDGLTVWVGTSKGRIVEFDSQNWNGTDRTPPNALHGDVVSAFAFGPRKVGYAIGDTTRTILTLEHNGPLPGHTWTDLNGPPDNGDTYYTAIDIDTSVLPYPIYVSTEKSVSVSYDEGQNWTDISGVSTGLPACPHGYELKVITEESSTKWLYLATFGWGVYRLRLN